MPDVALADVFADSESIVVPAKSAERIGVLVTRALELADDLKSLELFITDKKRELKELLEGELPQAMSDANCKEFKASDGRKVTVKYEVFAHITKDKEAEAFAWLKDNGHESLIKHEIKVSLDRGKDNVAKEIVARLQSDYGVEPSDKLMVHPQTLSAFCREQIAAGNDLPTETLGIHAATVARIK